MSILVNRLKLRKDEYHQHSFDSISNICSADSEIHLLQWHFLNGISNYTCSRIAKQVFTYGLHTLATINVNSYTKANYETRNSQLSVI